MGAGQSTGVHPQPPARALHVLRVTPSSPASQTNLEAFFDFVVGLEGETHSSRKALDAAELEAIVEEFAKLPDVEFAYRTVRHFDNVAEGKPAVRAEPLGERGEMSDHADPVENAEPRRRA